MLDLQLFAEGETTAPAPQTETAETASETESKTETAEIDIDAKLEAAMSKMEAKLEAKYEAKYKKQLAEAKAAAKKEAQQLEKMSEEERQKAEIENMRKEMESDRAAFEREKVKYEAAKVMAQRGLPVEFTEYLIAEDNESTLDRITTFEKKYKKAIEDGVNERLKGKAPQSSTSKIVESNKSVDNSLTEIIKRSQARR